MNTEAVQLSPVQRVHRIIVAIISTTVLFSALYVAFVGAMNAYVHRPIFLLASVICVILLFPSRIFKEDSVAEIAFNILTILATAIPVLYLAMYWDDMLFDSYLTVPERWLALLMLAGVFEAARRTTAKPLIFVVAAFLMYAVYGNYAPGILNHAGITWENALKVTVLGFDGIFGTPLAFAAGFVTLFVFFTALLNVSGVGTFLLNLTFGLCKNTKGGPGKVAVIGSALMGMVTGSGITNVLTTGTITIPLMKRAGYSASFAGGVEAVASTGSQFVPPILGASAFLLAEYTNTPFIKVAAYCLVPALLYYASLFAQVHFRSCRVQIATGNLEQIGSIKTNALKSLLLFIPMTVLIVLLFLKLSISFAIAITFFMLVIGVQILPETRMLSMKRLNEFVIEGASTLGSMAVALGLAGIVVGMLLMTGLGARLTTLIGHVAGDSLLIALIMCAIVAVIVGMGVVTVGAYVIVASLTAPLLIDMGMPLISAHLFIFYYSVLSGLSPPVAVVIFAAAGVAKAPVTKVAWAALKLGFVAWLVPFMFAFYPNLIGLNGINAGFVIHVVTALIGVIAFSSAIEGWAIGRTSIVERSLFALGGGALLYPEPWLAFLGLGALVLGLFLNWQGTKLQLQTATSEKT
ncbi:TRAP transporter fused permease subunit [Puniceibacterium sp. IMCC21224]|uniref:TRAP transporter permease n=1 Tax=Puniceibacterium sp. IMCC21224 TaxID=1618204 RepID=UPI00064E0E6B|nr:TRAP transporter fused permease subunit [Puniceibacterium sp. IMCC21224]KMK64937.1 TRAP transporter, 4TM/12TM fusion protein [Puniceibacterium sp. IMCC21224]